MKIEIKSRSGSVLFSYEHENNIIRKTLNFAIKECADLSGADLSGADISRSDLRGADLSGADLSSADLSCSDLSCSDLSCSALSSADLSCSDLSSADLREANISYADLSCAKLRYADLSCANLSSAKNVKFSQCSFDMHGECGRSITAVLINGEIIIFCGCFKGTEAELREYIEKGEDRYKKSRLFALEFVLKAINFE